MTDILIGAHSRNNWQRAGSSATLRIWFTGEFRDTNSVMIDPGNGSDSFYKIVPCTVNPTTHVLSVPPFTLPSTLDGMPANILIYGVLYDASGARRNQIISGWSLSNAPTSLPFDTWFIFSQGSSLSSPPDFYLNRQEVIALIDSLLQGIAQGIFAEVPAGAVDGVNGTFTLSRTPLVGSQLVFLNGILQQEGNLGAGTESYTISGATITHYLPPQTGDHLFVTYRTASGLLGNAPNVVEGIGALAAGGTTTVIAPAVLADSAIDLIPKGVGIFGSLRVMSITPGASFDVASDQGADAGNFKWILYL